MPTLTVITQDTAATHEIPFLPGVSVREVLERAGILVRTACRGNGACGLCLIEIEAGSDGPLTEAERLILQPEQRTRNVRLACQLLPTDDLRIRIINPVAESVWRTLDPCCLPCSPSVPTRQAAAAPTGSAYGLAVDLGTTQISVSLWDLRHPQRLHGRIGPNSQSRFGADIVTRLMAARESSENACRLARLPLEDVAEALQDMCTRDTVRPETVGQVAVVGNTAMLALLTESDSRLLLDPDNWTRALELKMEQPQTWASLMGIDPQAAFKVVSPLGGFVGSDLLAGVVATGLTQQPDSMLIDFGTNSEMALWDGHTLWVTSAAGGPAFECCGMRCGMPAVTGAIYRFDSKATPGDGELSYKVLGGGEAKGFCGSGLVDLIACLRESEELTATGNFIAPRHRDGYPVLRSDPTIGLTKRDVDIFQRAKAGIGAGIGALLNQAQLKPADLSRVCVCGVFGQNLDIRNAQRVGLLPSVPAERVELCGNTALAGCEHLLLSPAGAGQLAWLRKRAVVINLGQSSDFDEQFLEHLFLQPLKGGEA